MKTEDVIKTVGDMKKLCSMLECHRSTVYAWGGMVPSVRQYELEVKTKGALLSDYSILQQALSTGDSNG